MVEHHRDAAAPCCRGEDPEPWQRQVIEIPPITPLEIEHRLQRLVVSLLLHQHLRHAAGGCGSQSLRPHTQCSGGPAGQCLPFEFQKDLGAARSGAKLTIMGGLIPTISGRISATLEQPMQEGLGFVRKIPVVFVDVTGATIGNADGGNPAGKRGWQWFIVTVVVMVSIQGLIRSPTSAIEVLGSILGGIVVSDVFQAYKHLPMTQRQLAVLGAPDPRSDGHSRTPGGKGRFRS